MKKILSFLILSSILFSQGILGVGTKIFSYEQRLQRKHLEQARFDSIYAWRGWGFVNLGVRNNFLGEEERVIDLLPSIGFDRSYPISNHEIIVGFDVDGSFIKAQKGEESTLGGYGLGGFFMWETNSDCFLSLGIKVAQSFQNLYDEKMHYTMWMGDIGVGKRFGFDWGYFIDVGANFGVGVINDVHLKFYQNGNRVKYDLQSSVPVNLLGVFSMGKKFENQEAKISISPYFEAFGGGVLYETRGNTLKTSSIKSHFDLLLSIAYDIKMLDNAHFFTYADFNALQFEVFTGLGFRVEFGENKYYPLKYPKIKLEKLKKTYLK